MRWFRMDFNTILFEQEQEQKLTFTRKNLPKENSFNIIYRKKHFGDNNYFISFSLNDLIACFFTEEQRGPEKGWKRYKHLTELIIPKYVFKGLDLPHNHYNYFLNPSYNFRTFTNYLCKLFVANPNTFLDEFQEHITYNLDQKHISGLKDDISYLCEQLISNQDARLKSTELIRNNQYDVVIAKLIISSVLGLFSVRIRKEGKTYKKVYLLNKRGQHLIWCDTKPDEYSETIEQAKQYIYDKKYSKAFDIIQEIYPNIKPKDNPTEYAEMSRLSGKCLFEDPKNCRGGFWSEKTTEEKVKEGVDRFEESLKNLPDPEVNYDLYEYYISIDKQKANDYLNESLKMDYPKAVIAKAKEYCFENGNPEDKIKIIKKLDKILDDEKKYTNEDISNCFYFRGLLKQRVNDHNGAQSDFKAAAKMKHEKASEEVQREKRNGRARFPQFRLYDNKSSYCVVNSLTGKNLSFLSTLPSNEWSVISTNEFLHSEKSEYGGLIQNVKSTEDLFEILGINQSSDCPSRIVFLFMSEDDNTNLNECLLLLDELFNIIVDLKEDDRRYKVIDAIDIFVSAEYETASTLVDISISDMGKNCFFKVHILDDNLEAAHYLLCNAPLFLPCLNKTSESSNTTTSHVILFGDSEANYMFIKESIACSYFETEEGKPTVTLLGTNADKLEKRLNQECPGLMDEGLKTIIRPEFIDCDIKTENFPELIYGNESENLTNRIAKALYYANYIVVDLSNDFASISFAMKLRTWFLRSGGSFNRIPFIAVKCADSNNSYFTEHLTVSGTSVDSLYSNKYDLFSFGMAKELYSYKRLIEAPRLEDVALRIHKSYFGSDDHSRKAENDFYSVSYNADSSRSTALGLGYRLFSAGIYFNDKNNYLNYGVFNDKELLDSFNNYIDSRKDSDLERLAKLEQSRWNGFMISRGWESASLEEVRAYKETLTGSSHQHRLAKKHPFLKEWEFFEDNNNELLSMLKMLKNQVNYGKNPVNTTEESVKKTSSFIFEQDEKTQETERTRQAEGY